MVGQLLARLSPATPGLFLTRLLSPRKHRVCGWLLLPATRLHAGCRPTRSSARPPTHHAHSFLHFCTLNSTLLACY